MKENFFVFQEWNEAVIDWNNQIRAQNQEIKENNQIIKESIKNLRKCQERCLPLKSVLIYK